MASSSECALLIALITTIVGLYYYFTRHLNYWKLRGIDGPKPIPLFGTYYQMFFKSPPEICLDNTKRYGKIHGIFMGSRPVLVVAEPELVKDILVKDFNKFVDHIDIRTGDTLMDRSLINLVGNEWRQMRSIISPTFSSGKMRRIHPILIDCVHRLAKVLEEKALDKEDNEIELKSLMSNLTMDVIASCAFGTQIDSYSKDKRSAFVENAEKVFKPSLRQVMCIVLNSTFPGVVKLLGLKMTPPSVEHFFRPALKAIIERRKSDPNQYNDYLQLMLNAMNMKADVDQHLDSDKVDHIYGQTTENFDEVGDITELSEDDLLATSFLFFFAGYETTASMLSYLIYSLALNEECERRLYEEVKRFDGDFDYESISKMPYLEACLAETLRLFNPITQTGRQASEEYTIGDTGITIPKGGLVALDIQTLHHNPDYYEDPDKWDPERFLPKNRQKLVPYTYMPFGLGPRNCVGMRFALMEMKTAVAYLVHKFQFFRTNKTKPLTKPKKFCLIINYGELNVGVRLRNDMIHSIS